MSYSLAIFITITLIAVLRAGGAFWVYAVMLCAYYWGLSEVTPPFYDHSHFIHRAMSYGNIHTAILDETVAIAPVSPLLKIISSSLRISVEHAAIILNASMLALMFSNIHYLLTGRKTGAFLDFFVFIGACTLFFPTVSALMISANKDLCIGFGLSFLFTSYKDTMFSYAKRRYLSAFTLMLLCCLSYLSILQLRPYFAQMLGTALMGAFLARFLLSARLSRPVSLLLSFIGIYAACCVLLMFKWEDLRIIVNSYGGNSTIWPLYEGAKPNFLNVIIYPLLSISGVLFYPLTASITNTNLTHANISILLVQNFCFVIGLIAFVRLNASSKSLIPIALLFFFLFQIVIQPWGSPNIGSLMRLFLLENVTFATLLGVIVSNSIKRSFAEQVGSFEKNSGIKPI